MRIKISRSGSAATCGLRSMRYSMGLLRRNFGVLARAADAHDRC